MSIATAYLVSRRDVAMVFFVAAIFVLAVVYSVFSATTIGDNISTGGTLTVDGISTLKSAVYASTTLQVTGATIHYGNVAIGDATSSLGNAFSVHGNSSFAGGVTFNQAVVLPYLQATTTTASSIVGNLGLASTTPGGQLAVEGNLVFSDGHAYFLGPVNINTINATTTSATSTIAYGLTTATGGGGFGVGTATPAATLGVIGNAYVADTATTTITVQSTSATQGGCIELEAPALAGGWVRLYAGSGLLATSSSGAASSPGLVFEAGRCR